MKYVTVLTVLLLVTGCTTRKPEEPEDRESVYETPDRIQNLLWNLEYSFENLNKTKYMECYYDTFRFEPDQKDSADYPLKLADWDEEDELDFIEAFSGLIENHPDTFRINVSLGEDTGYVFSEADTVLQYIYIIEIDTVSTQTEPLELPDYIKGSADIYVKQYDDYYYISKWVDKRRNKPSFGELKALLKTQ